MLGSYVLKGRSPLTLKHGKPDHEATDVSGNCSINPIFDWTSRIMANFLYSELFRTVNNSVFQKYYWKEMRELVYNERKLIKLINSARIYKQVPIWMVKKLINIIKA